VYPAYKPMEKYIKCEEAKATFPPQHQDCQPRLEYLMFPRRISENPYYLENRKLNNKVAIITGANMCIR
jgi:hypothetical protein